MIHDSSKISIGERNSPEWFPSQNVTRRGLPVFTEKKAGLWIQIRVTPAIQNNSSDIPPRIETRTPEHAGELLTDLPLVLAKGCSQHFAASTIALLRNRHAGIRIENFQV